MELEKTDKTKIFCSVIILAVCAILWDKMLVALFLFLSFLVYGIWKKYFKINFTIGLIFLFLSVVIYVIYRMPITDKLVHYDGHEVILDGIVISLPEKSHTGKSKFVFLVNKLIDKENTEKELSARTLVYLNNDIKYKVSRGEHIKIKSFILLPKVFNNFGEFDYGKYLSNSRISTLSFSSELDVLDTEPTFKYKVLRFIDKIRARIIVEHEKNLPENKIEVLGGVVFGSEAIKPSVEIKKVFINSGLYHLLAASGMNVAFIFGIWFFIFSRLKLPYRFVIISGGIVVFFYALMTGLPPSVTRATWMLELALVGKLIDRNSDNNVILLLVCAILLIFEPLLLNDIGFLLSFVVSYGLINFAPPLLKWIKFLPAKVSSWFVIPFIAQCFAFPIQMYYFQTISPYSIFANVLVAPFMAVISFCGFISSIVALVPKVGAILCFILDKINEPFLTFVLFVAKIFSSFHGSVIQVGKLHNIEILLYYLLLFLFINMFKNKFRDIKVNCLALLLLLALFFSSVSKGIATDLTFTFFNVGEADSIFIRTPNNKKILVDTGKNYGKIRNSGNSVIVPFFKASGITSLDYMVLTHPDSDHIGGAVSVLQNISVSKIYTNGEVAQNYAYKNLEKYLNENSLSCSIIDGKQEISPDKDVSIVALKPQNIRDNSQNDTSIILLIKYKDFDAILMGDAEADSLFDLNKYFSPSGDVELFKVGHHGSAKSVDEEMAKVISPKVSVISVGENAYGHPSEHILKNLSKSRIFRTDRDNTIKIKTNGNSFDVYSYDYEKSRWKKKIRFKNMF